MLTHCVICNKEFELSKYQIRYYKQGKTDFCCSRSCRNVIINHNRKGTHREESMRSMIIKVNCGFCGKEFILSSNQKPRYLKNNNLKFYCTPICRNKGMGKEREHPYIKINKVCPICKKEFILSKGQYFTYLSNNNHIFYCSKSCIMLKSHQNMDYKKRGETYSKNYHSNPHANDKRASTLLRVYKVDNIFKDGNYMKQKYKEKLGVENPSQLRYVTMKKVNTMQNAIAIDGSKFDSNYEKYLYEYFLTLNFKIERLIPIEYNYKNKKHITWVDFKINNYLIECKGGHLLTGDFDGNNISTKRKLQVYSENNIILVTDKAGLKYCIDNKIKLVVITIDLFKSDTNWDIIKQLIFNGGMTITK